MHLLDLILGRPLATREERDERIGPLRGVAVLGLDALASAAYGPEALLTVLLPLGVAALPHATTLTVIIVALLAVVFFSYRQTIDAYPNGGGSYTVAKENLGHGAALVAAAALSLDYMLNVSVAISAGVGALVSAVPSLLPYTLPLCLGVLLVLVLVNLRGVRESSTALSIPTFVFVATLLGVIGVGTAKVLLHGAPQAPVASPATGTATLWLLVRAFSNGCTAMTGVEAVSNGVPIFRSPAPAAAKRTLGMIVVTLSLLVLGVVFACRAYHVTATPPGQPGYESILSRLTATIVGRGAVYHVTIASVVAVLALSANTSFAGFPRLCRLLSDDGFLPEAFEHRGRRLAFSHGILVLGLVAGVLLVVFHGVTDALIPLFAFGAFLAFTVSQAGMVQHWRKQKAAHRGKLAMNALGAACTGVTCVVVVASKLTEGAWISVLLVGLMIALFSGIHRHREFVRHATSTEASLDVGPPSPPLAIVPIRGWNAVTLKALRFALAFAPDVVAVQVMRDETGERDLTDRWPRLVEAPARARGLSPPKLVVLRSEYRQLYEPLLRYVTELADDHPGRQLAVIVPELIEYRWYHFFLKNHTASMLRTLLLFRGGPQLVIVEAPWYLRDWIPERRALRDRRLGTRQHA